MILRYYKASSLLGVIALLMTPVSFVLTQHGPTLGVKLRYAPSGKPVVKEGSSAV
ncbi:hypothetical protein SERLA73DRAFT_128964 [Serpula lacrymans var. lacrymans S7.3]|uniref:Uncharacterized protein n=2 Tax=Serpula lacrymans var. lacrymans TaxID=341189 RepID=F8PIF1_SERL3|nr:uncharacterized protein SERLADRAFT_376259 [Serpula lacrymans var. lacrymans S7.9]EGO05194.1 hypothetical protein SERLA73DRAFT_128964 [Serpula lacrymans var. lacrymans S7.3]EGO30934.1 hypothetical protein SERLADRAFT_376259 [Serpula lacrymans var. lacrymans S7.9]